MDALSESDYRRRAVDQTLASWRIEGFEPDPLYLARLELYVAGEITLAQVKAETNAEFGVSTTPGA